jgi:carbamoyl-phosphate synthase large subunit
MNPIRVVVTGAGSGVGQGIMKALRLSQLPIYLIAGDIGPLNCGLYRADEGVFLPRVEQAGALSEIVSTVQRIAAEVVMIGSEFDLKFYAQHREAIERATGALVVASPLGTVEIADDKWRTTEFLREQGLPYAAAHIPTDVADARMVAGEWGYPVILKPRRGTASRHVHIIDSAKTLVSVFGNTPEPMLQKPIARPSTELGSEYTCSVFTCANGRLLGPFTARRTLRAGSSWIVEVDRFADLEPLLLHIASKLPSLGSLNVQLMRDASGQGVPFEFNARFSGTTAVRAHFGFNEPAMVIRNHVLKEDVSPPAIRHGIAMRYLEEVFIEGLRADALRSPFPRGEVHNWF